MAYNYPYQQYPQQPYTQQMYNPQFMQPQMQSGGFMSVRNEQEARNYPVAPGNVMTFKIENQPYVCEKAQGFSQLEGPVFNKYRLVKEDEFVQETQQQTVEQPAVTASDNTDELTELKKEIDYLKGEIKSLKDKVYSKPKTLPRNSDRGGNKE